MKIRIDIDENNEEEIIIKCKKLNSEIQNIQAILSDEEIKNKKIVFFKDSSEYFLQIDSILFFETNGNIVNAHTTTDIFETKYKLYELEEFLPNCFTRISKSAIVNINHIYSINRNITSSSMIEFSNSHKKVYVSRMYFKPLKEKMKGRVFYER